MNYEQLVKAQDDKLEEIMKLNVKVDEESKKIESLSKKSEKACAKLEELKSDKNKIEKKINKIISLNRFCFITTWIFNIIGIISSNPIFYLIAMALISENFLAIPIKNKLMEKRQAKIHLINTCKTLIQDYKEDILFHYDALTSCQEQINKEFPKFMEIADDVFEEEIKTIYNTGNETN